MRSHGRMDNPLLLPEIIVIAMTTIVFAQNQQSQSSEERERRAREDTEHQVLVEALRRGGIKEAARIKGNYISYRDPHPDWVSLDLEKLTKGSAAVIVGVPVRNVCKLSENGQTILTVYDVLVQEVLKGDVQQGGEIKVALPGGKVAFADGSTAEIVTPDFEKMVNGRKYALYLSQYEIRPGVYELTAGPQGMIEMSDDGTKVKSQARETDPVKKQVKDKDVKAFLKDARRQAVKWPLPGRCCN